MEDTRSNDGVPEGELFMIWTASTKSGASGRFSDVSRAQRAHWSVSSRHVASDGVFDWLIYWVVSTGLQDRWLVVASLDQLMG